MYKREKKQKTTWEDNKVECLRYIQNRVIPQHESVEEQNDIDKNLVFNCGCCHISNKY